MAASGGKWKGLVAFGALMLASSPAMSQDSKLPWDDLTEPAAYITFGVAESDWTLYPVITANNDFIGFFGYLPDEFVIGDNVSLLWLVPDNGDGTWSMYGWSNTDLKVVSSYLDDLTGTQYVLADTGLDVFSGISGPIVEPKNMPFGIAENDPTAPIMEVTQDPGIAAALIAVGAAGAPELTKTANLEPINECFALRADEKLSQLDMDLAYRARVVQESMVTWLSVGILDSLDLSGLDVDESILRSCVPCTPIDNEVWTPWTAWNCGSGPFENWGANECKYSECRRSRTGWHVVLTSACVFTRTPLAPETQSPDSWTIPMPASGVCPASP